MGKYCNTKEKIFITSRSVDGQFGKQLDVLSCDYQNFFDG